MSYNPTSKAATARVTFVRKSNIGQTTGDPAPRNRIPLARGTKKRKSGRPKERTSVDEVLNPDIVSVGELRQYLDQQREAPRIGQMNAPLPQELMAPNLPSLAQLPTDPNQDV